MVNVLFDWKKESLELVARFKIIRGSGSPLFLFFSSLLYFVGGMHQSHHTIEVAIFRENASLSLSLSFPNQVITYICLFLYAMVNVLFHWKKKRGYS